MNPLVLKREEKKKVEESAALESVKYRDRAKERKEDQNPDYEPAEFGAGSFRAVAPPGNIDLLSAEAHKISIEKSKYLGGDVEHTHLVKGLDNALLNKVRSEIVKKPEAEDSNTDGTPRGSKEDRPVSFCTANAKAVYQWIVKPQTAVKQNDMFLPGRMAFIFDMESGFSHDIPTTVCRSKADCPEPEEMVTVSVDGSVLDRIGKIMSYLRLGSSVKILKKKTKDKDGKADYQNETEVGEALAEAFKTGLVKRDDLFITTKISFKVESVNSYIAWDFSILQGKISMDMF